MLSKCASDENMYDEICNKKYVIIITAALIHMLNLTAVVVEGWANFNCFILNLLQCIIFYKIIMKYVCSFAVLWEPHISEVDLWAQKMFSALFIFFVKLIQEGC